MSFTTCIDGGSRARVHAAGGMRRFGASALALSIGMALYQPAVYAAESTTTSSDSATSTATQQKSSGDTLVVSATGGEATAGQAGDYSTKVTTAGTRLTLSPRDIPQSISIINQARMQDQTLQTLGDVLDNTTGISANNTDSERTSYYARGFNINSYIIDDIPTTVSEAWNFGDTFGDTAIYDRIEVVRGANGLLSGTGNPGATVNMVRKHADSKAVTGTLSASYGSWNKQRYVADLSAPLTESGNVRSRVIAGYQDQDSWLDRYHKRKKFASAIIDADMANNSKLSFGYDYSESKTDGSTWGGLPTWYSNGTRTSFDRSTNSAPDWAYYNIESNKVFAQFSHTFANGWDWHVNSTHSETKFDDKLMYLSPYSYNGGAFPDQSTGLGLTAGAGWFTGTRKVDAIETYVRGPFELLGRQHEIVTGAGYSRQRNYYYASNADISATEIGNINNWNGSLAEPNWAALTKSSDDTVHQKSIYSAVRFSLADPLALVTGVRYTEWNTGGTTASYGKNKATPYAGVVYDINDTVSAYASYTSIFQPQDYRDANGNYLAPVEGKNYETGLKSDWFNGRLTATVAVFRIEQDNVAQAITGISTPSGDQAYYGAQGVTSKGVELELNGALTDNWQMTFGATRYVATDANNDRVKPNLPQTSLKLFTRYQLPVLPELAIGGGVNWQNGTYEDAYTAPTGVDSRIHQGSFALVNLFARYQVTKQLAVQGNINNLFDKEYYGYMNENYSYGAPRNFSMSLDYTF